jgi:hypothetical protein
MGADTPNLNKHMVGTQEGTLGEVRVKRLEGNMEGQARL